MLDTRVELIVVLCCPVDYVVVGCKGKWGRGGLIMYASPFGTILQVHTISPSVLERSRYPEHHVSNLAFHRPTE
jgi:hypothetical protein